MIPEEWKLTERERLDAWVSSYDMEDRILALTESAALKAARMALELAAKISEPIIDDDSECAELLKMVAEEIRKVSAVLEDGE